MQCEAHNIILQRIPDREVHSGVRDVHDVEQIKKHLWKSSAK